MKLAKSPGNVPRLISVALFLWPLPACSQPLPESASKSVNDFRLAVGTVPGSVEFADFNSDGKADIVVANVESNNVTVLINHGRGAFKPASGSPFAAGQSPNDIAVGDFNNDRKLDLALANHETQHVSLLVGDGGGRFTPAPQSPFNVRSRPHVHGIAAGDFNGDRNLDLVVENWQTNQVEILLGRGNGTFAAPGPLISVGRMPYQRLRVGDFNNDGYADIVTTNFAGDSVTILLSGGKNGFKEAPGSPFPAGKTPFGVAAGDLNGDGNLDLAVVNYSGRPTDLNNDGVTVLLGNGRGSFKIMTSSPFHTGAAPTRIAIGDVNGDGIQDMIVSNSESQNLSILLGSKRDGFIQNYEIAVGREPKGVAVSDVNGDGKGDIVVANARDNDIALIFGKGDPK